MPYVFNVNLKTKPADSSDTLRMETKQHLPYTEDNFPHAILKTETVYSLWLPENGGFYILQGFLKAEVIQFSKPQVPCLKTSSP
jgi:hypothetical protein